MAGAAGQVRRRPELPGLHVVRRAVEQQRTALNEAVALELLGLTGQATEEAFATRFSVNGGDEVLRLTIENPDDDVGRGELRQRGLLYKAESGGDYSYRGDDPEAYDEIFDQETARRGGPGAPDRVAPVPQRVGRRHLRGRAAQRLDVDAFADYLAFQELVDNFDDIDGPGNNSYLRYDAESGQFTVISWDLNLAFGGMGAGGMGGGMGGPGGMPTGGMQPPDGAAEPPEGNQAPEGAERPAGAGAGMGGPGGRSNILVERFMANETFAALYEQALVDLRAELYDSGAAAEILERWTAVLTDQAADLVDTATIEQEASSIEQAFRAS